MHRPVQPEACVRHSKLTSNGTFSHYHLLGLTSPRDPSENVSLTVEGVLLVLTRVRLFAKLRDRVGFGIIPKLSRSRFRTGFSRFGISDRTRDYPESFEIEIPDRLFEIRDFGPDSGLSRKFLDRDSRLAKQSRPDSGRAWIPNLDPGPARTRPGSNPSVDRGSKTCYARHLKRIFWSPSKANGRSVDVLYPHNIRGLSTLSRRRSNIARAGRCLVSTDAYRKFNETKQQTDVNKGENRSTLEMWSVIYVVVRCTKEHFRTALTGIDCTQRSSPERSVLLEPMTSVFQRQSTEVIRRRLFLVHDSRMLSNAITCIIVTSF